MLLKQKFCLSSHKATIIDILPDMLPDNNILPDILPDGTLPYGAVVVLDGEIVGEGLNRSVADCDPTSHGEVEAIRNACRRLSLTSLKGAELYTTGEPCSMCVATMYQVGISRLFYAGTAEDSAAFFQRLA